METYKMPWHQRDYLGRNTQIITWWPQKKVLDRMASQFTEHVYSVVSLFFFPYFFFLFCFLAKLQCLLFYTGKYCWCRRGWVQAVLAAASRVHPAAGLQSEMWSCCPRGLTRFNSRVPKACQTMAPNFLWPLQNDTIRVTPPGLEIWFE